MTAPHQPPRPANQPVRPTLEQSVRRKLAGEWRRQADTADTAAQIWVTVGDTHKAEEKRIAAKLLREHAKLVEGRNG
jgi:hypothetical protein